MRLRRRLPVKPRVWMAFLLFLLKILAYYWNDVTNFYLAVLCRGIIIDEINKTHIFLIPKVSNHKNTRNLDLSVYAM